jgi:hypothetical protein
MKRYLSIIVFICAAVTFASNFFEATAGKAESNVEPDNSVTAADKDFFRQIRRAILVDDVEWLSKAMSYPAVLDTSTGKVKLRNANDFKKHAKLILSSQLKSVVRNQSPDALFKNWQGVMAGDGEVWFDQEKTKKEERWVHRIHALGSLRQANDQVHP